MKRSILAGALLGMALVPGTASGTSIAGSEPAPPVRCETVTVATEDPGLSTPPAFEVPPGGTCADVLRDNGDRVLELRYADGRIWAQTVYGPIPQATTYFLPDGTALSVVPSQTLFFLPSAALAVKRQRERILGSPSSGRTGRSCPSQVKKVRGRPGTTVSLYLALTPAKAWVDHRGSGAKVLAPTRRLKWVIPRSAPKERLVAFGVRDAEGRTGYYRVCVETV